MQNGASKDPLRALTFVGRLLLLMTLIVAGGVFYYVVMYVLKDLPVRSFPVAFILIPVVIGAGVFFLVVSLILQVCRIPVWTEDVKKQETLPSEPPASAGKSEES
jgi:uncharacterized PurR-regulated membrane protein YhhQ (DUF165 family)